MSVCTSHEAVCVAPVAATLGEGPLWVADASTLYWVDIAEAKLLRYTPDDGRVQICRMPFAISAVTLAVDGRLLCTSRCDIHLLDVNSGALHQIGHLDLDEADRINDGSCHPDGTFWFGTMDMGERRQVGNFYRLSADGISKCASTSHVITNGPAFSADGRQGYFVDTFGRRIFRSLIRTDSAILDLRQFAKFPDDHGFPDGVAADTDGGIWCAHWGGGCVTRFDSEGRATDVIRLPVSNVTKCAFAGEHLDHLYITTARKGLGASALASQPLAGGLFVAKVDRCGVAASHYRGEAASSAHLSGTCFFEASS